METLLLNKMKLNHSFSCKAPTFQSSTSELDALQLEINNIIMTAIKIVTEQRNKINQ